jgi:hypothetical protein
MTLSDKAIPALVGIAASIPSYFTNELTEPMLGVGVSTVAGAVLGTYAAIGYDDRTLERGKLFTLATATVILASAITGVIPSWMGWAWVNGGVEGGVAALAALFCYYALPEAIPTVRRLIRDFKLSDLAFFRRKQAAAPAIEEPPADQGDPGK